MKYVLTIHKPSPESDIETQEEMIEGKYNPKIFGLSGKLSLAKQNPPARTDPEHI
jgi:hypothetical protein